MQRQAGLTAEEAEARLRRDGPNELPSSARLGLWRILREVVSEPMFLLLMACGVTYLMLGDRNEALMLLGFVFIVIVLTVVQKHRSEAALDALRELSSPRALVLRGALPVRVPGKSLVVGDLVLLAEGDRVPADLELLETSYLTIDESQLTGESAPVLKQARASGDTTPARRYELCFSGCLVTQGTAQGRVVATGSRSALGRMGSSLAGIVTEDTPIQREMASVVRRVALAGGAIALALALGWGISRGDWLTGFLAGLTLAMALLPEELPVVLTIFLSLSAWRLSRERVLTRHLPVVERLGATTVLCVDKTGTLTRNQMEVRRLWVDGASFELTGQPVAQMAHAFHPVLEYAVLSSHRRAFDPMETAIGAAGRHWLQNSEHLHADWALVSDYPLSRELLAMSRVWRSPDLRELVVAAKGAPEAILDLCHASVSERARVDQQVGALAADGLRILGVARAVFSAEPLPAVQHGFDFEFVGLIALEDPVRADVPGAIAECREAGIRVAMITGDHPSTALAIAREAGLEVAGGYLTGADLDALSDASLATRLSGIHVFCRIRPEQKLRLVEAFKARGDVVAMTGDGVNDAQALKAAHIGVAMGGRGSDVAREAADLILLDDDFKSLVTAIRYGRRVFTNLRKAIVFVVAVHVPIVGLALTPLLTGWPLILMPAHILFLQLIIDPACSVVFEGEALEPGAMRWPPRSRDARLFDGGLVRLGLLQGGGLLVAVLAAYLIGDAWVPVAASGRTAAFIVLVTGSLALIQVNRSWARPAAREGPVNGAFRWLVLTTVLLLAPIWLIPDVARLFQLAAPSPVILLPAAVLTPLTWAWARTMYRVTHGRRSDQA